MQKIKTFMPFVVMLGFLFQSANATQLTSATTIKMAANSDTVVRAEDDHCKCENGKCPASCKHCHCPKK